MKKMLNLTLSLVLSNSAFAQDFNGVTELAYLPETALQYIDAPSDYFSGKARFARYPTVDQSADGWAIVEFDTGTINHWHSHTHGQYLIITEGIGLVQEWGKSIRIVKKGDAVWFPPNIKHWHGAAPNSKMTHIVVTPNVAENKTTWLEAVDATSLAPFDITKKEDIQQTTPLSDKQLSIVPIAAFSATGNLEQLKPAIVGGLENGLTVNELKEIFAHQYAYAGFPRALNGLLTLQTLLKERAEQGIQDLQGRDYQPIHYVDYYQLGTQTLNRLNGRDNSAILWDFDAVDYALKAHLFGYLFSRDNLSVVNREIVTVSTLASLETVQAQLRSHFSILKNLGISQEELQRIIRILAKYDQSVADKANSVLNEVIK